ncbi:MAG: CoA transferase [Rhodospirillaceae bacterium]|nr:CoA transferase [Rhodospirillaceae bacterium]|tara:strand:+ start:1186 stop:2367 length:1182 start_codon:yes stop_codon:yes gene_type:complete
MTSKRALERFSVLDLTRVRSGPTAVRQLADWGAKVIKVELPEKLDKSQLSGPRSGSDFQNLHRNKRSLSLDLKSKRGLDIFKKLVSKSDIVVENFRPDVKHRLGIDYETLKKLNDRLIYASISGFGQNGPYKDRPGFDQIAQGMGGLMSITGKPGGGPMRVGIPIADLTAGLFCAQGIMIALLEREVSGQGQWVQTSLLQAQAFMLDFQAARWLIDKEVPAQAGNNHPTVIPTGVFRTLDGHINIAGGGQIIWRRLCDALELSALITDSKYESPDARSNNRDKLNKLIEDQTVMKTSKYWVEHLNANSVPCGEINSIDQVFENPQIKHLEMVEELKPINQDKVSLLGQPVIMSRSSSEIKLRSPESGEHNKQILEEIGYSKDEITDFYKSNII